jgi:hypothetical protein
MGNVISFLCPQVRQFCSIDGDPSSLVFREHFDGGSPLRFLLVIDLTELLAAAVLHDEDGVNIFDSPGRRQAANVTQ